jgi:hypothetical protein
MGLSGKPKGFDGGEVERYFREGNCETDVVGTYQLSQDAFETSHRHLQDFINRR